MICVLSDPESGKQVIAFTRMGTCIWTIGSAMSQPAYIISCPRACTSAEAFEKEKALWMCRQYIQDFVYFCTQPCAINTI